MQARCPLRRCVSFSSLLTGESVACAWAAVRSARYGRHRAMVGRVKRMRGLGLHDDCVGHSHARVKSTSVMYNKLLPDARSGGVRQW